MLGSISNTVISAIPAQTSYLFYGAAALVGGGKFGLAAGCKMRGLVAERLGDQSEAAEWTKSSDDYWTQAKKDAVRNLTIAAGLAFTGLIFAQAKQLQEHEKILWQMTELMSDHIDLSKDMSNVMKDLTALVNFGFILEISMLIGGGLLAGKYLA